MNETIHINWLLLVSPFLWTLGCAVILALLGHMQFLNASAGIKCRDFIKKPLFKKGVLIGICLIVSGFLLNFAKIPSEKLIAVKLNPQNQNRGPLKILTDGPLYLPPRELDMDAHNKSHILNNEKMKNSTMVLFWDGYIRTPFLRLKRGNYTVTFQAKGSKADDEYSQVKIEFEVPDKNYYLVTEAEHYFHLTDRMETYRINIQSLTDTLGRIRITYFNDLYLPKTKEGRDVWIRNLVIANR
jgi:hypothetical protein